MSAVLQSLSIELADAVESAGRAVVAIHARRRIPASGVHWRPGVIVATHHTINRDDNITVTLPDGTTASVSLAGRDPSTDLAVLKLAGQNLATANLRLDPSPSVGEFVIALGRPGPRLTASWGVVSSVAGAWRTWQGAGLLGLGGAEVSDPTDVLVQLGGDRVGRPIAARVIRGGQVKTLQVTPGERPESRAA